MCAELFPNQSWHQIACEILATDVDLALLLIDSLRSWDDHQTVTRTAQNARRAYDDVCRRRPQIGLSRQQEAGIEAKLEQLRMKLRSCGETV
jgi:hypothetical protein